jgi:hypothetical protein
MESVFEEYIKSFDSLASTTTSRVNWGIDGRKDSNIDPFFKLLDSFVHTVHRLTLLDKNNADSLMGEIRYQEHSSHKTINNQHI